MESTSPNSEKNELEHSNKQRKSADEKFIGQSAAFEGIIQTIEAVAARKCSVIVYGETGTGKEMVARRIHDESDRGNNIFVPVDCTTLTGQLFESQLFGHVKGAFTGAVDNSLGFFRAADGGTIFLDEISEIPLDLQAKLLRVLQEERLTPVGATESIAIDVRVLCATNRDLREMVAKGEFRADLYYRLNVVTLEVPPLRDRPEDILLLAEHFLNSQSEFYDEPRKKLSERTVEMLLNYSWPGNVRELANAMERAYVLTPKNEIYPGVLPTEILMSSEQSEGGKDPRIPTLDEVKRRLVSEALRITNGKKIAAAEILGIERRSLNRMLEKYNMDISDITDNDTR